MADAGLEALGKLLSAARPLRVLHIITGMQRGGAEEFLSRLILHLPQGVESSVISLTGADPIGHELEARGVAVRALGGLRDPRAITRLMSWIREARPDVVQTWMYHANLLGGLAARLVTRAPVVWCIHATHVGPPHSKYRTMAVAAVSGALSRLVPSKIVCCAQAARVSHAKLGYDDSRMLVLANGVDTECFAPDALLRAKVRQELGIAQSSPVVGMIGRYHPVKDHAAFFEVASLLRARLPDVRFVLAGLGVTSETRFFAEALARHDLASCVHLLGVRDDVPVLMKSFDLLVNTSRSEALPNVLIEAMATGVPCAATDVGDNRLIIGDTGFLSPPRDMAALAAAAEALLTESSADKARRAVAVRRRIEERFGIDAAAGRYYELYKSVLDRRPDSERPGSGRAPQTI